jgi:hypothetical protein
MCCMKNEDKYCGCADWLFLSGNLFVTLRDHEDDIEGEACGHIVETILELIEDTIGAKILDKRKASRDITDLLDHWHELGNMVPTDWIVVDGCKVEAI